MSVAKDQAAASVALGSNVHPLVRTYSVTNLSQQHNDFEALMVELERDPESAAELADARAWVADTFTQARATPQNRPATQRTFPDAIG